MASTPPRKVCAASLLPFRRPTSHAPPEIAAIHRSNARRFVLLPSVMSGQSCFCHWEDRPLRLCETGLERIWCCCGQSMIITGLSTRISGVSSYNRTHSTARNETTCGNRLPVRENGDCGTRKSAMFRSEASFSLFRAKDGYVRLPLQARVVFVFYYICILLQTTRACTSRLATTCCSAKNGFQAPNGDLISRQECFPRVPNCQRTAATKVNLSAMA